VIESRLATVGDAVGIGSVQLAAWNDRGIDLIDGFATDDIKDMWVDAIVHQSDHGRVMVTTWDDQIVGYCAIERSAHPTVVALSALEVLPDRRNHGVGSRLINMAADVAGRMGAHEIRTWIGDNEATTMGFLESAGWALTGASRTVSEESRGLFRFELELKTQL
jgi:GNAT superfamily N-acetyltransferase